MTACTILAWVFGGLVILLGLLLAVIIVGSFDPQMPESWRHNGE